MTVSFDIGTLASTTFTSMLGARAVVKADGQGPFVLTVTKATSFEDSPTKATSFVDSPTALPMRMSILGTAEATISGVSVAAISTEDNGAGTMYYYFPITFSSATVDTYASVILAPGFITDSSGATYYASAATTGLTVAWTPTVALVLSGAPSTSVTTRVGGLPSSDATLLLKVTYSGGTPGGVTTMTCNPAGTTLKDAAPSATYSPWSAHGLTLTGAVQTISSTYALFPFTIGGQASGGTYQLNAADGACWARSTALLSMVLILALAGRGGAEQRRKSIVILEEAEAGAADAEGEAGAESAAGAEGAELAGAAESSSPSGGVCEAVPAEPPTMLTEPLQERFGVAGGAEQRRKSIVILEVAEAGAADAEGVAGAESAAGAEGAELAGAAESSSPSGGVCDVTEMAATARLERVEGGGTKEGTLPAEVEGLHAEYRKALATCEAMPYDMLDMDSVGPACAAALFEGDFRAWCAKIATLDARMGVIVKMALDNMPAVHGRLKLLDAFEDLLERPRVQEIVDRERVMLIKLYAVDLRRVAETLVTCRDDPPIGANLPPVAGALFWCCSLRARVNEPLARVMRALAASTAVDPRSLSVNVDPTLVCLLREVKYFLFLSLPVPASALAVYSRADTYQRQAGQLDILPARYNEVLRELLSFEAELVKPQLRRCDAVLAAGIREDLDWTSPHIDTFNIEATAVTAVCDTHAQLKSGVHEIAAELSRWSSEPLWARKPKPMTVDELGAMLRQLRTARYAAVTEGGRNIERRLRETAQVLKITTGGAVGGGTAAALAGGSGRVRCFVEQRRMRMSAGVRAGPTRRARVLGV